MTAKCRNGLRQSIIRIPRLLVFQGSFRGQNRRKRPTDRAADRSDQRSDMSAYDATDEVLVYLITMDGSPERRFAAKFILDCLRKCQTPNLGRQRTMLRTDGLLGRWLPRRRAARKQSARDGYRSDTSYGLAPFERLGCGVRLFAARTGVQDDENSL